MRRRSLIFRYTLAHATLFLCVLSGALAFLYLSTLEAHQTRQDAALETEAEDLHRDLMGLTSVREMAAVVTRRTTGQPGATTVYMLATSTRQYVAGNLRQWPDDMEDRGDLLEFPIEGERSQRARGRTYPLPTGDQLLVARNLAEADRFRSLVENAFLAALVVSLALGIGGAFLVTRRVSHRLDEINRNSIAVLQGDLERRMPESGRGDEVDELAGNLNRMLDRITTLMAAMREVTDDIAHDMRSPISRLRSRIEVTLMSRGDEGDYRRALEQTIADADAILLLFNSLLTIAHAESGEPRKNFRSIDAAAIVADAVDIYEPAAEEAGLEITHTPGPPALLEGNPDLLGQAIANLLDNALKYVPRGGHVHCAVQRDAKKIRIRIADDGPGIPDEFRAKAFDRFSRMEASRTSPGSGLGLSLVRAIAHLHDGEVRIEDGRPGLVVNLELPVDGQA